MKRALLALTGIAGLVLILTTFGAAALGPEILGPAREAIENMPEDARDTSGVDGVLDTVEETLSGSLPEDVEIPTEFPEDVEIPAELPDEADVGLDAVDSALEFVPVEIPL